MRNELIDIAKKYGQKQNLIDMVHQHLQEEQRLNNEKRVAEGRIGKFYPSSVGQCRRKIAYQMLGYPGKPTAGQNLLIMDNGTYFHNRMEETFEKMGILVAPELKLTHDELRISGRSDAIVWNWLKKEDEPDGEIIQLYKPILDESGRDTGQTELIFNGPANDVMIVEFKSIKSKKYDDLPKTKPKKEHNMQLQLYMYLTGIRAGLVYYENKDNQEQKYYYMKYDETVVEKVISDIRYVISHIDEGKLPERDFPPVSFDCRFCDFRDICYPIKSKVNLDDVI